MGTTYFIVLGLVLWVILACWPAVIAKRKGYNFWLFLAVAILISFLLALIIIAMLKDKNETAQDRADEAAARAALKREEDKTK